MSRARASERRRQSLRRQFLTFCATLAAVGCSADRGGPEPPGFEQLGLAEQLAALRLRGEQRAHDDHGAAETGADLRPEARRIVAALRHGGWRAALALTPPRAPSRVGETVTFAAPSMPASIRIWRKGLDGSSTSCSGRVDVIPFDDYVKGVLPHEWIRSWEVESLRAGAIAIRSYAAAWVAAGGKYDCADLNDTTASQVYKDERYDKTSQAVDDTAGVVLVKDGKIVLAEYSAENGDPTKFGVAEPLCAGEALFGHGRGMCQWGSQRWATQGKDHRWIAVHYYPGASLAGGGPVVDPCDPLPASGGELDEGPCFELYGPSQYWRLEHGDGRGGSLYWTNATEQAEASNWAKWRVRPSEAGEYKVEYHAVTEYALFARTRYEILHDGQQTSRIVDQAAGVSGWRELGTFRFAATGDQHVAVFDNTDQPVADDQHIIADAIRLVRVGLEPPDAGPPPPPADAGPGPDLGPNVGIGPGQTTVDVSGGCGVGTRRPCEPEGLPLIVLALLALAARRSRPD